MTIIKNDQLFVEIAPLGAELQSVRDNEGRSWLWDGDPAFWTGRSPLLFPVIGRTFNEHVLIEGKHYPIEGHGFPRTSLFEVVDEGVDHCTFRLSDSERTRRSFPFAFHMDAIYSLRANAVRVEVRVTNDGERSMPFCFGYHPAIVWPLPGCEGKPHLVKLENGAEPALYRIDSNALLKPEPLPSPFKNGELEVAHSYFNEGAMIFKEGAGDSVWFGAEGELGVRVDFPHIEQLGLWTKPGAPYLCIEPWQGITAPAGRDEPLEERQGVVKLAPGEAASFVMGITFGTPE
jgi:galactose mutarotase-like enzyme